MKDKTTFDNILFDLDGTITDSYEGITKSVAYALEKMGIAPPDDRTKLRVFIGPPLWASFSEHYGLTAERAAKAVALYREYYNEQGMYDCTVYDGVQYALETLRAAGKKLILATSKPEIAAIKIIKHFGLDKYFDVLAGASSDTSRVEKADVIAYAVGQAKIDRQRSVMVGDRLHDVLGAKANGMKSIGVLYGFGSKAELINAGADFIVSTPKELTDVCLNI